MIQGFSAKLSPRVHCSYCKVQVMYRLYPSLNTLVVLHCSQLKVLRSSGNVYLFHYSGYAKHSLDENHMCRSAFSSTSIGLQFDQVLQLSLLKFVALTRGVTGYGKIYESICVLLDIKHDKSICSLKMLKD